MSDHQPLSTTLHSKSWWTPELTACKLILSKHFNKWCDEGFPRETDNTPFNCYQLARKNFRKAIKAAQTRRFSKNIYANKLSQAIPPPKILDKHEKTERYQSEAIFHH